MNHGRSSRRSGAGRRLASPITPDPLVIDRKVIEPRDEPGRCGLVVRPSQGDDRVAVGDLGLGVVAGAVDEGEQLFAVVVEGEALVGGVDVPFGAVPDVLVVALDPSGAAAELGALGLDVEDELQAVLDAGPVELALIESK